MSELQRILQILPEYCTQPRVLRNKFLARARIAGYGEDARSLMTATANFTLHAYGRTTRNGEALNVHHALATGLIIFSGEDLPDPQTVCIGIGHDILRDTAYTVQEVKSSLTEYIARGIRALTVAERDETGSTYLPEEREMIRQAHVVAFGIEDASIYLAASADQIHTLLTCDALDLATQDVLTQAALEFYIPRCVEHDFLSHAKYLHEATHHVFQRITPRTTTEF